MKTRSVLYFFISHYLCLLYEHQINFIFKHLLYTLSINTSSKEILYSPVDPVLIIRNRVLLFVVTVNISKGTVLWFSVLLFETENEVYVITVDVKYITLVRCFSFPYASRLNFVSQTFGLRDYRVI